MLGLTHKTRRLHPAVSSIPVTPEGTFPCPFCGPYLICWTDEGRERWIGRWSRVTQVALHPRLCQATSPLFWKKHSNLLLGASKVRLSPPALWRPLCHSELTLWRTYCTRTRVRQIEAGAKVVHSALERTLGIEKENREERCTERQFQTEKSWLREHAL